MFRSWTYIDLSYRGIKVSKYVIRNYVRPYEIEGEVEREQFNLVGPEGLNIHPVIWPAGINPGCIVDLILWHDQEPRGRGDVSPGEGAVQDVRQREMDVSNRESDARDRERHIRERERDARDRERDARERERDARDREQDAQQRQQPPEPLPPPPLPTAPPPPPQPQPHPQQQVSPPSSSLSLEPSHSPDRCGQCCNLDRIRKHRACLSFFAGQSRLRDLCKCNKALGEL